MVIQFLYKNYTNITQLYVLSTNVSDCFFFLIYTQTTTISITSITSIIAVAAIGIDIITPKSGTNTEIIIQ